MLQPNPDAVSMNKNVKRVWEYLMILLNGATEKGIASLYKTLLAIKTCIYIIVDLNAFLQFVTGSPYAIGKIGVTFEENDDAEAISANTCGKQLTLSANICEEGVFVAAMMAVIKEIIFTMP